MGVGKMPWPGLPHVFSPGNRRKLQAESVTGEDNRANANARLTPGQYRRNTGRRAGPRAFARAGCRNKVPPVPLFSVMVREHACTGQFYHDVVEAGSCEQALHLAAGQASGRRAPAGPGAPPGGAGHRGCAGAWGHSVLRGAGGGTRPAAPGRRARVLAPGPAGAGRPRPGARTARVRRRPWHAGLTARQVTGTAGLLCSW